MACHTTQDRTCHSQEQRSAAQESLTTRARFQGRKENLGQVWEASSVMHVTASVPRWLTAVLPPTNSSVTRTPSRWRLSPPPKLPESKQQACIYLGGSALSSVVVEARAPPQLVWHQTSKAALHVHQPTRQPIKSAGVARPLRVVRRFRQCTRWRNYYYFLILVSWGW